MRIRLLDGSLEPRLELSVIPWPRILLGLNLLFAGTSLKCNKLPGRSIIFGELRMFAILQSVCRLPIVDCARWVTVRGLVTIRSGTDIGWRG